MKGAAVLLGSRTREGVHVRLGHSVVAREEAPHFLAGPGRQPELALLELKLERLPELQRFVADRRYELPCVALCAVAS
jgi:hypothetical protein